MNDITNDKALEKYKFDIFLCDHGFRDAKLFDFIKFSGGTQSEGFIGWIPYLIIENEIYMLFIPYRRRGLKAQKPDDESHFETLFREAKQESGIEVRTETLWKAFQRNAESFDKEQDGEIHKQVFYASQIFLSMIKFLLSFRGYNKLDQEKGRPILAKLRNAYRFLPPAHLDASKHTIELLTHNIDNPLYISGAHDRKLLLAHFAELHPLLARELRQRLRRKEERELAEVG